MLTIVIPECEIYDEVQNLFVYKKSQTLVLEHSLISIAKWEAKWNIPFIGKHEHSKEQLIDYVRCMTVTQHVDDTIYKRLTVENIDQITEYINAPMTATTFSNKGTGSGHREIITSELIYYWMIAYNIPFDCEKWHIKRLLTLIRICEIKNTPPKKRNRQDVIRDYAAINAANKKRFNTKG